MEMEKINAVTNCVTKNSKILFKTKDGLGSGENACCGVEVSNALEKLHLGTHVMTNGSVPYDKQCNLAIFPQPHASSHHSPYVNNHRNIDNVPEVKQSSTSQIQHVRTLVEEALENLENSLRLKENLQEEIEIIPYESELQMPEIMRLIQKDLSEPYSIYTYRYFIHNWPKLCFLAMHGANCIGAIVCKLDMHRNIIKRGYIAMLAVDMNYRKKKIGSKLVKKAIEAMLMDNADEVVLETEISNEPALKLYENLGFVRDKRLFRYYLNGVDALRLKLWLR